MKLAYWVSSEYSVTLLFVHSSVANCDPEFGLRRVTECVRLFLCDLPSALRDLYIKQFQGRNSNDDDGDDVDDDDDDDNNNNDTNVCTHYHICRNLTLLPDILRPFKIKSLSLIVLVYILNIRWGGGRLIRPLTNKVFLLHLFLRMASLLNFGSHVYRHCKKIYFSEVGLLKN
jgi:hypothetical protein